MPDFVLFYKAFLISTAIAGVTLLLAARTGRNGPFASRGRQTAGWILSLAAGIYAGCGLLDQWPRWPALEDRDRLLVVLLPLTLAVEAVTAWLPSPRLARLLRWSVALAAAPILLYNTTYLADLAGPGSAEWSTWQATAILLTLGAALIGQWELLALYQSRTSPRAVSAVLAIVCLATGFTVMLSGYYRGGLMALPLAGAMAGAALAAGVRLPSRFFWPASALDLSRGCLGVGLVGTYAVLVVGRFFGALPSSSMICLFVTPLLAWITQVPGIAKLPPRIRGVIRLAAVVLPLIYVVSWAQMKFTADFAARSKSSAAGQPGQNLPQP